jgi:hypothetical protein
MPTAVVGPSAHIFFILICNHGRAVPTAAVGTVYADDLAVDTDIFLQITIKSTPSIQQCPLKSELCTIQ